ncbi:MAG TPA: hypothetical protein VF590_08935, partial [Isosphaeraceae bacterium]
MVRDELPKGLTTAEGRQVVEFNAGDLASGQSRDFSVQVNAARTGEYASRAVAEGANDLSARSNRTTTQVQQAKLAVNLDGPSAQYANETITYRIRITNEGELPAQGTQLKVQVDRHARVLRMSKSAPGEVTPRFDANVLTWNLGTIRPNATSTVSFTIVGRQEATFEHTAAASARCARGTDTAGAATTAAVSTEVLTFPALLLEFVDQEDPVRVGETELYIISVINQGSGEDRNVQVVCTLPQELEYVDSVGPTKPQVEGRKIRLGTLERLGPRDRVTWKLQARALRAGDVRTRVELSSDYLNIPVPEVEPTRLIGAATSPSTETERRAPEPMKAESRKEQT